MFDRSNGHSLREGFIRNALERSQATAIVVRDILFTYEDLDRRARKWAAALTAKKQTRPERVGLFAYRSDVAYAGTLAALYAGATYVPLNPTFPIEKTASMLEQADVDAIIVDKACMSQAIQLADKLTGIAVLTPEHDATSLPFTGTVFDSSALENIEPLSHEELPPLTPDDTAYLLFTSGSTGVPKGVPVSHGNVLHFIDVMSRRYGITPEDRFSQTFDQTFDLSVFDLFMAWTNGASVYAMSPVDLLSPTKFITRNQLTVWFSVPSVAAQMRRRNTLKADTLPSLRWSLFCGEPLPQESAEAWQIAAPNSVVENLYGPTELTIACLAYRWNPANSKDICRNGVVPIGRPYEGLSALVVNESLSPVSDGGVGELCISGPQTTAGYWRAPEKTAERYVELAIGRQETRRFYRTGDLVAQVATGDYVFVGRADSQIKVLGHRVELGEIEAVLRSHPAVEQAAAFGWPLNGISADGIVAFVSGQGFEVEELTGLAKQNLPPYVVPRRIIALNTMPLNPNGKVDRRKLQDSLNEVESMSA